MGLAGLIKADSIEWMSVMTYQSASGAGAKQVRELIAQSAYISQHLSADELTSSGSVLPLVNKVSELINSAGMPVETFGVPLMGSIIPWIDSDLGDGNSREEWKGEAETNKILGLAPGTIPVNGLCIRVGVIRCHSAAITLKLKREVSEAEFAELVTHSHPWVNYVRNNKQESVSKLTPAAISGSLQVGIGRYKKMSLNNDPVYSVLTVGDQLLWGAAEPLRRMLNILLGQNIVTVIRGKALARRRLRQMFNEAFENLLVAVIFIKLMRSESLFHYLKARSERIVYRGRGALRPGEAAGLSLIHVTIPR